MCTHEHTVLGKPYLEVRAGDTSGELLEEWLLNLYELLWVDDVKDLLHLTQVHHLLRAVCLGPETQQTSHNLKCVHNESTSWLANGDSTCHITA